MSIENQDRPGQILPCQIGNRTGQAGYCHAKTEIGQVRPAIAISNGKRTGQAGYCSIKTVKDKPDIAICQMEIRQSLYKYHQLTGQS